MRVQLSTTLLISSLHVLGCASESSDMDDGHTLQLRGDLVVSQSRSEGRPVAALLYSDSLAHLELQDLTLTGTFPTDVQLTLLEPPPDAALYNIGALGEPKVATAFLTMVPESHPDSLRYATETDRSVICEGDCKIEEHWCADDLDCYYEARMCPDENPGPSCTLQTAGDEALEQPAPWDLFAGVSDDYVFVYVSAPLPLGSVTAALFGSPMGMSAGYHVLKARSLVGSQLSDLDDCWRGARDEALAQLNAEDQAEYTWVDLLQPCPDEHSWTLYDGQLCERPLSDRQAVRDRFEAASWRARQEQRCGLSYSELGPADLSSPLSIHLPQILGSNPVVLF